MTTMPNNTRHKQPVENFSGKPVENSPRPVENPARKILDAMSLTLKTSDKAVTRSSTSGVRDAVENLREVVRGHDLLLNAIFDALDFLTARVDAIEKAESE